MARGSLNTNYFGNVKAKATRKICIVVIAKSNQSMQNFDQMRRRRRLRHARQISPFCRCCDGAAARGRAIAYGPNRTGLMVRGAPQAAPLTMRVCPFAAKQALVPRHPPEANVSKDGRERDRRPTHAALIITRSSSGPSCSRNLGVAGIAAGPMPPRQEQLVPPMGCRWRCRCRSTARPLPAAGLLSATEPGTGFASGSAGGATRHRVRAYAEKDRCGERNHDDGRERRAAFKRWIDHRPASQSVDDPATYPRGHATFR